MSGLSAAAALDGLTVHFPTLAPRIIREPLRFETIEMETQPETVLDGKEPIVRRNASVSDVPKV
jgi:hypothetical protein